MSALQSIFADIKRSYIMASSTKQILLVSLVWRELHGLSPYHETVVLMEQLVDGILEDKLDDTILLVEHEDVYTSGTNAKDSELLKPGDIPVLHTGRGGKFTYHGAGQRVIYPILNLTKPHRQQDLKLYVRMLENWIISTLQSFEIEAYTIPDKVGIWSTVPHGEAKIGAIGIRIKRWVTYHGIAVNISTDLTKFAGIIPCGLEGSAVTSMQEIGVAINMHEFDEALKKHCPF